MSYLGVHTQAIRSGETGIIPSVAGLDMILEDPDNRHPRPGRRKRITRQFLVGTGIVMITFSALAYVVFTYTFVGQLASAINSIFL